MKPWKATALSGAACVAAAVSVAPDAGHADVVAPPSDWSTALVVEVLLDAAPGGLAVQSGGPDNPLVIFGFNPQPEPPALSRLNERGLIDPELGIELDSDSFDPSSRFELLVGIVTPGGAATLVAPADLPDGAFSDLSYAVDTGARTLSLDFEFETSSGGQALDAVSFNPQPEPPAFLDPDAVSGLGLGFTAFSTARVTLSVRDENGDAVDLGRVTTVAALAPVPLPLTAPLLAAGLGLLVALRRRA